MKNQIKLWLHRLPVLLTALMILVSPLVMVAPAHADVLSDSASYYLYWESGPEVAEGSALYVYIPVELLQLPGLFVFGFEDNELFGVYFMGFNLSYDASTKTASCALGTYFVFTGQGSSDGDRLIFTFSDPVEGDLWNEQDLSDFSAVAAYDLDDPGLIPLSVGVTGSGVLDVFSGVGGWISRSISNIADMFWTADGGMSVLGYLAVASLALAFILLIFSLIASWLKFH